jgi:hypothetical protein
MPGPAPNTVEFLVPAAGARFTCVVVKLKQEREMDDLRLIAARRLVWNKDAWRDPGYLALVTRWMKSIVEDEAESAKAHAEAAMLMKKLYLATNAPAEAWVGKS